MPLYSNGSFARNSNGLDIIFSVTPDEKRNQQAIELAVEQIRKALNKDFGFNIEAGNIDEVIKQIEQLGVKLNAVKNNKGYITSLSTSFANANGTVLTLNTNIQSTIKSLSELQREAKANGNPIPKVADLYRTHRGVDSNGEIVTDWNKRGSIVGLLNQQSSTTTSFSKEQETVITKLIKSYQILNKEQSKMGTVGWTEEVAERVQYLRAEIDKLKEETRAYLNSNNLTNTEYGKQVNRTINRNEYASQTKVYQEQLKIIDQIREKTLQLSNADKEQKAVLEQQLSRLREKQSVLEKLPVSAKQQEVIDNYKKESETLQQNIETIRQKEQNTQNYISALKELSSIESKLAQLDAESNPQTVELLQQRKTELEQIVTSTDEEVKNVEEAVKAYQEYEQILKKINAQKNDKDDTQKIKEALDARKQQYQIEENIQRLINNKANATAINEERDAYLEAKKAADDLEKSTLSNGKAVGENSRYVEENSKLLKQHDSIMKQNDASVKSATKSWAAFGQTIKDAFTDSIRLAVTFNVSKLITDGVKKAINTTIELDSAMTQVRLVTGQTREEVQRTMNEYANLAIVMGDTTASVAEGSLEWLRQGKTIEEATELMRSSTMLAKLGVMESSDATEKLTAVMNSYKLEASEAADVVSKIVNIDILAATSSQELATSLQRVASMASASNISLDKMIGLIATGSETTRLSAETINLVA